MRWLLFVLALAGMSLTNPAKAQTVNVLDLSASTTACGGGVTCGSIGVTAQVCVPAINTSSGGNYPRNQITIANDSAGASIFWGYSSAVTANGIGGGTIAPGQTAFWPRGTAPGGPIYCIASGAATPAQIAIGQ